MTKEIKTVSSTMTNNSPSASLEIHSSQPFGNKFSSVRDTLGLILKLCPSLVEEKESVLSLKSLW